jgi:5-methylcytosine-specific restriction protein B
MDETVKHRIEKIDNPDAVRLFFRLIKILIDELNLTPESAKLALTVAKGERHITVNLNTRYALRLNPGSSIGFMVRQEDFQSLQRKVKGSDLSRFSKNGVDDDYFVTYRADTLRNQDSQDAIVNAWLAACRDFEPKASRSPYRDKHNTTLFELASDEGALDAYLGGINHTSTNNPMDNRDSIHADLIRKYKIELQKSKLKDEIYKWNLLGQYKGRPRTDARSFKEELKSIKFHNLLFHTAVRVSQHLANEREEQYRDCVKLLFDETIPLQDRITDFSDRILAVYREIGTLGHHHDERTIATFLTFHNPEKYSFYKDSFYQKYCKLLGIPSRDKGKKYVHYLELLNQFKEKFIETDRGLLSMVDALIPTDAYKDPTHTLLAQDILYTMLDKGREEINIENASVYKISMGSLSDDELEECIHESLIVVHKDTKGKGTSSETQADLFEEMEEGDLFYLTHGNRPKGMKLLGRVTGKASASTREFTGVSGWLERKFEVLATSVNQAAYKGTAKWWTPNNNSTCIQIKPDELDDANELLFQPYFNTRLISSSTEELPQVQDKPPSNEDRAMPMPLNQILFGPPGTGKTYKLLKEYYPLFTSKKQEVSEDQYRIDLVSKFTWWQVVAAAVVDIKSGHVTDILNHPLVQIKDSVSDQKNARAMIWAMLQTHTKADCEFVKYSKRYEPLFFNKDEDGNWTIDIAVVEAEAPEVIRLLKSWKKPVLQSQEELRRFEFVTFHQSFSYEDFVEGIKPVMEDEAEEGDIRYKIEDGIFKRLCAKARRDSGNNYALFIDEINRGNVSQIFGELITLIEEDKREGKPHAIEVDLPYSKMKFSVPPNVYIVGTMNTADRSVEALDSALRRRFSFVEMPPLYDIDQLNQEWSGVILSEMLKTVNKRLEKLLSKDHLIGHSFLLGVRSVVDLKSAFQNKILPLLQEYFYGDFGKIGLVLGSGFLEKLDDAFADQELFAEMEDYDVTDLLDKPIYRLKDVSSVANDEFEYALQVLMRRAK